MEQREKVMSNSEGNYTKDVLVGVLAGVVAGLLLAPKSGKETREDLKSSVKTAAKFADAKLHALHEEITKHVEKVELKARDLSDKAKKEAYAAIDTAKKARDQLASVSAAVRSGTSDDEDLDIAVKNANNALDNLKKYLKK